MPEENEVIEQNLEQEESQIPDENQEMPDESAEIPEEGEETQETPEGDQEDYTDDWDEWREGYNLPKDIDSPEALAESYQGMLREMKRLQSAEERLSQVENYLKSQGVNSVDSLFTGPVAQQPEPSGKSYFKESPVHDTVEEMIKRGRINSEAASSFRAIAEIADQAYSPQFRLAEQVMTTAMQQVLALRGQVRDMQWSTLDGKVRQSINRSQADDLINRGLVSDYSEAAKYLAFKNPNLLRDLTQRAEQSGRDKARKKWRRSNSLRTGKSQAATKWDYGKYMTNGEFDLNKVRAMGKRGDQMLEDWMREHKQ